MRQRKVPDSSIKRERDRETLADRERERERERGNEKEGERERVCLRTERPALACLAKAGAAG